MIKPSALTASLFAALLATTLALPALRGRAGAPSSTARAPRSAPRLWSKARTACLIHVVAKGLPPGPKAIHIHSVGTCEDGAQGFVASRGPPEPGGQAARADESRRPGCRRPAQPLRACRRRRRGRFFTTLASLSGAGGRAASSTPTAPRW